MASIPQTERERNTMLQNLHFKPDTLRCLFPKRAKSTVAKWRDDLLTPGKFIIGQRGKDRAKIHASLIKRGWSTSEAILYFQACQGDQHAVQKLKRSGLWGADCKGVL